jgi:hypothetical protein
MTEEIEVLSHCQGCEALYSFYFVRAIELFKKWATLVEMERCI